MIFRFLVVSHTSALCELSPTPTVWDFAVKMAFKIDQADWERQIIISTSWQQCVKVEMAPLYCPHTHIPTAPCYLWYWRSWANYPKWKQKTFYCHLCLSFHTHSSLPFEEVWVKREERIVEQFHRGNDFQRHLDKNASWDWMEVEFAPGEEEQYCIMHQNEVVFKVTCPSPAS